MNLRAAFWQPGEWFKFACLDKSIVNTTMANQGVLAGVATLGTAHNGLAAIAGDGVAIGSGFGVNPGHALDGIWAFTGSLNVDF